MDDLDRWTRVLPLGAGAFGEVHLAWDHVDSRWVALKRFTGQDELGLLRMVIESRIRVSHPHLVRTLAFRLVDDRAWLVTELARGGSLRALMTRAGALPWGWVAEAVDQVLAALTALHASGVVHRDLKPANLLLRSVGSSPPHLLVGDFGIATWRTVSMTGIGAAIGTPGYLAPEYLDGHAPAPATDLFAVGVLAAEMLTGRRLVHYSNASPSMPSSWRDVLPVPAGVPAALATVLQRMAAPDPGWRYRDCTQAREALLSAVPPGVRGDLTTVEVPDLLGAVPPGWGPEGPTKALPAAAPPQEPDAPRRPDPATSAVEAVNLVGLPIDGGPTALVPENAATLGPGAPLAAELGSGGGSATDPGGGSATSLDERTSGSSAQPAAGSATPPTTPPHDPTPPPTTRASGSATPATTSPSDPSTQASTGSATPPSTTPPNGTPAHPPAGQIAPPTRASGSPAPPATPPRGSTTQPPTGSATSATPPSDSAISPATPPRGSAVSARAERKAVRRRKVKRKVKQAFLLLVVVALLSGGGTLWWAATHRTVAGRPSAVGRSSSGEPSSTWVPTVVAPCAAVEIDSPRRGEKGTERCQRTPGGSSPQSWVEEPPGGFPKSNAGGPFPGEACTVDGDRNYSPVGDHVECDGTVWKVIA